MRLARSQARTVRARTSASSPVSRSQMPAASRASRARAIRSPSVIRRTLPRGRILELFGREVHDGGVDQVVEVAVERGVELVHGEADAMVGDAVFLEVVRPDLLRPFTRADL